MNITKNIIDYCKHIKCNELLDYYNIKKDYELYQCINPEHDDSTASMKYYENSNLIHCFGCNTTYDSISIYAILNNLDFRNNFLSVVEKMYKDENIKTMTIKSNIIYNKKIENKKVENSQEQLDELNYYLSKSKSIDELRANRNKNNYLDIYLNKRAIDYDRISEILKFNKIELRHIYIHNYNSILVNIDNRLILQRTIDDYLKNNSEKSQKYIHGASNITRIACGRNPEKLIIVEGIYDALSIITNAKNVKDLFIICLNSVENIDKFFKEFSTLLLKGYDIYCCTDNDNAGDLAYEKIKENYPKLKINRVLFSENDIDEHYINLMNKKKKSL